MKTQRAIMAGTLAFAMTIGGTVWGKEAHAGASPITQVRQTVALHQDEFQQALGMASDEEIYSALYNGDSLADIANANRRDAQQIIDLQVRQLQEQLDARLSSGSISLQQYDDLTAELVEIVTRSVYGQ